MPHSQVDNGYQPACVIAGAGADLGLAIAERYADQGFRAYVLLPRPTRLGKSLARIRDRGLEIASISCDVSKAASVEEALRRVHELAGRCDVVIYHALAPGHDRTSSLQPKTAIAEFVTGVAGALAFVNATVDEMRSRSNGAMLFSICLCKSRDSAARHPSIVEAALRALVASMAGDVEPDGIRVGMLTIEGAMPTRPFELRQLAELYWQLFATSESARNRELLFKNQS
jgi:meso-butanediol dehydrogenase / (S,S)-butanediol dehydrogenase / diacetyl reductase